MFNVVWGAHGFALDDTRMRRPDIFREDKLGNYVEVIQVARRYSPPELAAAVLRPGGN